MSSEPPEEPHLRSEPSLLSPASPKPIHFPTPTNIPILEMQMDVGFNQTETHMNDPAMRDTGLRPDVWRDPNEQTDHASPFSTGHDAPDAGEPAGAASAIESSHSAPDDVAYSKDTSANEDHAEPVPISTSQENGHVDTGVQPTNAVLMSSDPSVPAGEAAAANLASSWVESDQVNDSQAAHPQSYNGPVDFQALLDTLQPAPASSMEGGPSDANVAPQMDGSGYPTAISPSSSTQNVQAQSNASALPPGVEGASSPLSASGLGVPPSGLPPRPPPQEQPLIHPNYVHSQHIRDYHPHATNPAFQPHARSGSQGNAADPSSRNYVPPVHSPSNATAPQSSGYPSHASIPSSAQFSNGQQTPGAGSAPLYTVSPSQNTGFAASPQNMYSMPYLPASETPIESRRESKLREGEQPRPEDRPWDAEVQRKYDRFIEDERRYVSEGRWEQFPQGSRLFVGNLSSEKVTKRDIFHVFHTYGDLAQISIKQAYGFVQFLRTEDCVRALDREQGTQIRDKKIHLEVSKPQKNRSQPAPRRSRSPTENTRGRAPSNVDRYVSGSRGGNNRGSGYGTSYRSPSPRGYRDRQDDRFRRRSRSPDYSRGGRFRSPSPRRDTDDDLPLPRRAPRDVPDVQIVVLDTLDRDFISWVEQAFKNRGIRVDVLLLSPRLSEQAVIRRQIMEGVVAVVKLTRHNQNTGKIGLQIFDRRQGVNNVKFEEYEGQDPSIAVELVLRAKGTGPPPSAPPSYSGYAAGPYGAPPAPPSMPPSQPYGGYGPPTQTQGAYGQPPQPSAYTGYGQTSGQGAPAGVPPNLQNLITNLDSNNLQNLLSAMSTPQSANSIHAYANQGQPNAALSALQNNPALAGYLQQQHQQQQQQQQGSAQGQGGNNVNMQEILARLGTHQR